MASFVSAHAISCMTRQDLERLVRRLASDANKQCRLLQVYCDTVSARMVCHWEAPDREALLAWWSGFNLRLRGNEEWVIHSQLELRDGRILSQP